MLFFLAAHLSSYRADWTYVIQTLGLDGNVTRSTDTRSNEAPRIGTVDRRVYGVI